MKKGGIRSDKVSWRIMLIGTTLHLGRLRIYKFSISVLPSIYFTRLFYHRITYSNEPINITKSPRILLEIIFVEPPVLFSKPWFSLEADI